MTTPSMPTTPTPPPTADAEIHDIALTIAEGCDVDSVDGVEEKDVKDDTVFNMSDGDNNDGGDDESPASQDTEVVIVHEEEEVKGEETFEDEEKLETVFDSTAAPELQKCRLSNKVRLTQKLKDSRIKTACLCCFTCSPIPCDDIPDTSGCCSTSKCVSITREVVCRAFEGGYTCCVRGQPICRCDCLQTVCFCLLFKLSIPEGAFSLCGCTGCTPPDSGDTSFGFCYLK